MKKLAELSKVHILLNPLTFTVLITIFAVAISSITAHGNTINGTLESSDCFSIKHTQAHYADVYAFTLTTDATVIIDMETMEFENFIYLYSQFYPSKDSYILRAYDNYGPPYIASMSEELPAGTYYIEVTTSGRLDSGNYTINSSVELTQYLNCFSYSQIGTLETSDCFSTQHTSGAHYADVYTFTLPTNDTVIIDMETMEFENFIYLCSEDYFSGGSYILRDYDNYGPPYIASMSKELPAGTYYIEVTTNDSQVSGNYNLRSSEGMTQVFCNLCGNDVIDEGEECDGDDLGGETCESLGFKGGTLACSANNCTFDTSGCIDINDSQQVQLKAPWRGTAQITQGNNGPISHNVCYERTLDPTDCSWENTYAIDIAMPDGTEIIAPADGIVTFAQLTSGSGGREIAIEHSVPSGGSFTTVYLHLSEILVTVGNYVKQGQLIAKSGSGHLHFHIWDGSEAYDMSTTPFWCLIMKQLGVDSDFECYGTWGESLDHYEVEGKEFESNNIKLKNLSRIKGYPEVYWLQGSGDSVHLGKAYHVLNFEIIDDMSSLPGWGRDKIYEYAEDVLIFRSLFPDTDAFEKGPDFITTDSSSNGLLIRQSGKDDVFRVQDGQLEYVSYEECQHDNCWPDIIDVTDKIIDGFLPGPPPTSTTTTIDDGEITTTTAPNSSTSTTPTTCPAMKIYGVNSEEVQILRYFRDNVLSQTSAGQEVIKLYYQWSPVIVEMMEEDEEFKQDAKELIDEILLLIMEKAD